jgi:hypothetical protein
MLQKNRYSEQIQLIKRMQAAGVRLLIMHIKKNIPYESLSAHKSR